MSQRAKEYIEKNIDLIDDCNWEEFFSRADWKTSIGLGSILYEAGIDFISDWGRIPDECFRENVELTQVVIPNNVTYLGQDAFYNCRSLVDIAIPENVSRIAPNAFFGCSSLKSINIPASITTLEESCFSRCTSLNNIVIPQHVTCLESYVFEDCSSLVTIRFTGTLQEWMDVEIRKNAFKGVPARYITCSDGVTRLRH